MATEFTEVKLEELIAENKALKEELTARREVQAKEYVAKPLDLSEYRTRKIYIDSMLVDAGWTEGKDLINVLEISGMPNQSGVGYADYVLFDNAHRPLAVIEAKKTCIDISQGRQQAALYANLLEKSISADRFWKDKNYHRVMPYFAGTWLGEKYAKARGDLIKRVSGIAGVANIPEIQAKSDFIQQILYTDYLDMAGICEFEHIREELRNLMKYIPIIAVRYDTDFTDDILNMEWKDSELESDELENYRAKAEYYVREHQDNIAIAKQKTNQPLTGEDVRTLEEILWGDLGTKEDCQKEYGEKPLGEFVREIVGLDMNAAKEAFSEYLESADFDSRQIYFVNQIVEYGG
ncbi:MAG: hypothetical protein NC489_44195 [Ruminococcus flavefaciens]|nr:hypothetical protein [Ruminococcus flavefaciens]